MLVKFLVCVLAGLGAGIGTGLAGLSAAAVISPMLVTFLGFPSYQAIAISLASDVLASAVSAYTYGRHKNLDIKNGSLMLGVVLVLTLVGSLVAFQMPNDTMSTFSVLMTLVLGLRFIICPVTGTHSLFPNSGRAIRVTESVVCGIVIGFICGFIGAGGGMMMLLVFTSVLGYELKTAVGTSVFIMTFTALTGAVSHVAIGGSLDLFALVVCAAVTLVAAQVSAVFANRAEPKILNRVTGGVLAVLGTVMLAVHVLF